MSSVSSTIQNPNSFHPISLVSFTISPQTSLSESCSLHLLYRLSPSIFIDPYELSQRQHSYTFTNWGKTELEKPVHAIENTDAHVLFTINVPSPPAASPHSESGEAEGIHFDVEVPLHARYLAPLSKEVPREESGSYRHIPVERPQAFFACPSGTSHIPTLLTPTLLNTLPPM